MTAEGERECWSRERNCVCLKLDVAPGETFIFPYQQLLSAQHLRASGEETLKLWFGTHQVVIPGRQFGEIAAALQDLAVEQISVMPARYRELPQGEGAWVKQIDITFNE